MIGCGACRAGRIVVARPHHFHKITTRKLHYRSILEATQGLMDGFFSQLPYKCYLEVIASEDFPSSRPQGGACSSCVVSFAAKFIYDKSVPGLGYKRRWRGTHTEGEGAKRTREGERDSTRHKQRAIQGVCDREQGVINSAFRGDPLLLTTFPLYSPLLVLG